MTTTPASNPIAEAAQSAADATAFAAAFDPMTVLFDGPAPETDKPAEVPQEPQTPAEPVAEEKPAEPEATPATPEPEHKPGTPDKVLQQLQQDNAAALRKIGELEAKLDAGTALTGKEQQQLEQAKRKLDTVREKLEAGRKDPKADNRLDVVDDFELVADALLEQDQTAAKTAEKLAALEAEVKELRSVARQQQAVDTWAQQKAAYPGVAVQSVWTKACEDAALMAGVDAAGIAEGDPAFDIVRNIATNLFHQRADAAVKSAAARKSTVPPAAVPPATPATTPGGARVQQQQPGAPSTSSVPPSEESEYVSRALSLVV